MNWIEYISNCKPNEVYNLLSKYGYDVGENELLPAANQLVNNSEQFTIDLLKLHPEYEAIAEIEEEKQLKKIEKNNRETRKSLKDEILQAIKLENIESQIKSIKENYKLIITVAVVLIIVKVFFYNEKK